jgi:hypothetical protein
VYADARIALTVDDERRREFDVGVIEVGQFGLPVVAFEFEKQRPQDGRFIEIGVGVAGDVRGRHFRARLGGLPISAPAHAGGTETAGRAETTASRSAGTAPRTSRSAERTEAATATPFFAFLLEEIAGLLTFVVAESTVVVFVELVDDFSLATGAAWAARTWCKTAWRAEGKSARRAVTGWSLRTGFTGLIRGLS